MKENYKCSECGVCSYCLQRRTPGTLCYHPVKPIYGHCPHYDDITPAECELCVEGRQKAEAQKIIDDMHAYLDELEAPGLSNPVERMKAYLAMPPLRIIQINPDQLFEKIAPCKDCGASAGEGCKPDCTQQSYGLLP